ncbi:50S ribosomal protein L19e [[Eubacterium] cellulosolvens]
MTHLSQRRIAAAIMKVGENRVWVDPDHLDLVEAAITRDEIRRLIHEGIIKKSREQGISKGRQRTRKKRKGHGSRKGSRQSEKRLWVFKVRKQRKRISELREGKKITPATYRKIYMMIKGGAFRNIAHLNEHLETSGLIKRR